MADGVWLLLPDKLTIRLFFEAGIVNGLEERLGERLVVVLPDRAEGADWAPRVRGSVLYRDDLVPLEVGYRERVLRRIDRALDRHLGYYPLAMRLSRRNGFHAERMRPGHPNWMLDSDRDSALPRWAARRAGDGALALRSTPLRAARALSANAGGMWGARPLERAAARRRFRSWSARGASDFRPSRTSRAGITRSARASSRPSAIAYVVQNDAMRDDLVRYHGIPERTHRRHGLAADRRLRPASAARGVRRLLRCARARSVAPARRSSWETRRRTRRYEDRFVERAGRVVESLRRAIGRRSSSVRTRATGSGESGFARRSPRTGVAVQERELHGLRTARDAAPARAICVVANAGTILLDALVNDRPVGLRPLRRGRPAGREPRAQEPHRRALPRARGVERLLPRVVLRGGRRRASSARSHTPRSSRTSGAASPCASSERSTGTRASAWSTRSSRSSSPGMWGARNGFTLRWAPMSVRHSPGSMRARSYRVLGTFSAIA